MHVLAWTMCSTVLPLLLILRIFKIVRMTAGESCVLPKCTICLSNIDVPINFFVASEEFAVNKGVKSFLVSVR